MENYWEMRAELEKFDKAALQNIAARAGYRAKPHSMNKGQLADSIVRAYHEPEWLTQDQRDWILKLIQEKKDGTY